MYLVRTVDGVKLEEANPGGCIKVPVYKLSMQGSKYHIVYIAVPNDDSISKDNHMQVDFSTVDTSNNNSYLSGLCEGVELTAEHISLLKKLDQSPTSFNGEEFYTKVYDNVISKPTSRCYYVPKGHNSMTLSPFFNVHTSNVKKVYTRYFGYLYAILVNYDKFDFMNTAAEGKARELLESVKYADTFDDLFDYFMMENDNILNLALLPFLLDLKTHRLKATDFSLKKLNGLKSFCKRVLFLKNDQGTIHKFVAQSNFSQSDFIGWAKLVHIYQALKEERGEYVKFKVTPGPGESVYVNGTNVSPSYFNKLYDSAYDHFRKQYDSMSQLIEDYHTIEEVYEQFLLVGDQGKGSLISGFTKQIFSVNTDVDKQLVVDVIDSMTLDLLVLCYISGANSFRFPELRSLQFNAPSYEERNTVYYNDIMHIKTFTNKNKRFDGRLRIATRKLSKVMVAYLVAVRPLYIELHGGDLPKVTEQFFTHRSDLPDDKISALFYKCYIFVTSKGRFISSHEFKSHMATLLGKHMGRIVTPRKIRQAISYFFRHKIVEATTAKQGLIAMQNQVKNEKVQGHANATSASYGGLGPLGADSSITQSDYIYFQCLFREWFKFIGIEDSEGFESIFERKEVAEDPDEIFLTANGGDVREAIGDLQLRADQMSILDDLALSTETSNVLLGAPTGWGKSLLIALLIKAHKIAARRSCNKKVLNLVLVPYQALKFQLIERFEKAGLNVLHAAQYTTFSESSTADVMVGCVDVIASDDFLAFLYNFKKYFGRTYKLSSCLFDESQSLVCDFSYREFKKLKLQVTDLFHRTVMISATIPKNFITFLKKKWGYDCGRYINLITSDPLAKIFNTSTSFKERDRIMDYVVVSMKNFLQRDVNDIALLYFENKIIQENYYRRLCSEFGDKLMVMINADTENKQASLLRLTRGARVLLGTKS
ncbi:uncharacterized protein SPAPADRAFT_52349 [Spathaspora passalidarum NRRL Y-27907]|uniref:Helicase ATP-binding domain-containing protein n=1 Tax=Spathaspora passalidarum (strain NRRL Y-27907 / 11-Y1) TaxID=619300 RepID=G3AT21_SPAPN|nr:uncharacterized protein SPAPADRAFT_52349 [Spathaspora passalidarum NRRL Y-27907]EGW31181.1 hypothetical protein SPAPADRAFT_52349 [Spathaspora passalidarum NRRL Y-27907]